MPGARYRTAVRLVIARCSVDYAGRLTAHLPLATRLLLVKADGSVLVHADGGSYKPLNWMSPPCTLGIDGHIWTVTNKVGERLVITMAEVLHDHAQELGVDPGLQKDGVETHLQRVVLRRGRHAASEAQHEGHDREAPGGSGQHGAHAQLP